MTTRFEQLLVLPLALAIFIALSATPTPAAMIAVTNDVASNTTWFATNTYLLQTVVFVRSEGLWRRRGVELSRRGSAQCVQQHHRRIRRGCAD
jgi:hypothetical protein